MLNIKLVLLSTALGLALATGWLVSKDGGEVGTALGSAASNPISYSGGKFHLGQEVIVVLGGIENESSSPIEITDVSFGEEDVENVILVEVGLLSKSGDQRGMPQATYQTSPPMIHTGEHCLAGEVEAIKRVFQPGELAFLAFHLRFDSPGPFEIKDPLIHYRAGGRDLYEKLRLERVGVVRNKSGPVRVRQAFAKCADPEEVLAGNQLPRRFTGSP